MNNLVIFLKNNFINYIYILTEGEHDQRRSSYVMEEPLFFHAHSVYRTTSSLGFLDAGNWNRETSLSFLRSPCARVSIT